MVGISPLFVNTELVGHDNHHDYIDHDDHDDHDDYDDHVQHHHHGQHCRCDHHRYSQSWSSIHQNCPSKVGVSDISEKK